MKQDELKTFDPEFDKKFFPVGAIAFFIGLLILFAAVWASVYALMQLRA